MFENPSTPSNKVKFDHSAFSPVTVSVSPVSKSPQVGNLTGNVRQVRDNAADLHNLVAKWNKCLTEGASLVDAAMSLKLVSLSLLAYIIFWMRKPLQKTPDSCGDHLVVWDCHDDRNKKLHFETGIYPQGSRIWGQELEKFRSPVIQEQLILTPILNMYLEWSDKNKVDFYPPGLSEICESLDLLCCEMTDTVILMKKCFDELCGVNKLETLRATNDTPMFLTWPSDKFAEVVDQICKAYSKELELKIFIKENIAHLHEKADLIFYRTSWVLQPYISNSSVHIPLAAILKETGHK